MINSASGLLRMFSKGTSCLNNFTLDLYCQLIEIVRLFAKSRLHMSRIDFLKKVFFLLNYFEDGQN